MRYFSILALSLSVISLSAQVYSNRMTLTPSSILPSPETPPDGAVGYVLTTFRTPIGFDSPFHADWFYSVNGTNLVWYEQTADVSGEAGWYLLGYGSEFSPTTLSGLTPVAFGGSIPLQESSTPFYMGLAFGVNSGGYNFGWGEFINDASGLRLIDSAFSYNGHGVYIGTLSEVPEPDAKTIIIVGLAVFSLAKKFHSSTKERTATRNFTTG